MQLCGYVFSIGFPLYVPKNEVFGGFEGEDVILALNVLCVQLTRDLFAIAKFLLVHLLPRVKAMDGCFYFPTSPTLPRETVNT